ncbi:MAG: transcriptional regulator [Planctomycetes bacterium]|nr:transcriptional regulator [Planctomycetota bacterium]
MPHDLPDDPGPGPRRVAEVLKRHGPATPAEVAAELGLTSVAVRQHLGRLEALGLAHGEPRAPAGRGRPSQAWRLTSEAMRLFPDRHGELTVGLVDAMRGALGEAGLNAVLEQRADAQAACYLAGLPASSRGLRARIDHLARLRSKEGYMAEVRRERAGTWLLIEHHCPICEAASTCVGLCRAELDVFRRVLGPGVEVERIAHLLADDDRCVYRIKKAGPQTARRR